MADTHALVWWVSNDLRLTAKALELMDRDSIGIAAITCWEIAQLTARGRLELDANITDWWDDVVKLRSTALLPLTIEIAITAASLPDAIRDPADRLIVATAMRHSVPLVTKDERIRRSGVVETIW